jgi:hypothetical protein
MAVPSYFNVDSDRHPYIYGQTYRDLLMPLNDLLSAARQDPKLYEQTRIIVYSRSTWPLPWYLSQFKKVSYLNESRKVTDWSADVYFVDQGLLPTMPKEIAQRITQQNNATLTKVRQWADQQWITMNPKLLSGKSGYRLPASRKIDQ